MERALACAGESIEARADGCPSFATRLSKACMSVSTTDYEVERRISRELDGGERLLWSGRPRQGLAFRRSDIFLVPVTLMWGGFAIFWEFMVIKMAGPWFMMAWGVPFVLVGLYMIAGRFFWDASARARTYYGVSDKRVILISGVTRSQVRSINLRTLGDISLTERPDGSGDITLGAVPPFAAWNAGTGWPFGNTQMFVPTLELVPNARDVYETLRRAQVQIA